MEELGTHGTVTVHFWDGGVGGDELLDADFALAKALQEQEEGQSWSLTQNVSASDDACCGWEGSSSIYGDYHTAKLSLQLKRDEALARALEDADDQEQLMIMLSLQESYEAPERPQVDRSTGQDDPDPDMMSYEELLGLSEVLGTQNQGLTPEEISKLPVKKFKKCCFRNSRDEHCVICQHRYEQCASTITLPCKHTYHAECIRKWLEIKKVCPICNVEVKVHHYD